MSETRKTGGLLVGFAALGAILVALQPKPATHPSPAGGGKHDEGKRASLLESGSSDSLVREGPTKPIWDFLALAPAKTEVRTKRYSVEPGAQGALVIEEPSGRDPVAKLYDWPNCCDLEDYSFHFLIATVPDPIDYGFPSEFDQMVEALQRALEADGYVIDRAWVPWPRSMPGQPPVTSRLHELHPGLVLFRADEPLSKESPRPPDQESRRRLLALLLVGESPTFGIHKIAFRNAVRVVHSCPGHKAEGNRIRVLGPYFSGSAISLKLALREARKTIKEMPESNQPQEPWIKVVCGSASGFSHSEFVEPFEKGGWVRENKEDDPVFTTTVLPSAVRLHWTRKYLGNPADPVNGQSPAPIVVFREANTSYGQQVSQKNLLDDQAANKPMAVDQQDLSKPKKTELFLVSYPLHISQLRSSYTKEQLARAESQGLPRTGRNLPFPSDEQGHGVSGRETIPARDPLMTAAFADLILDNVITTMAQKGAHYACLLSTDDRDSIFLARAIRDRHPDVQLFTLGSNLLFTHEDYNYELRGMIVGSTYPLYPSVQRWSDQAKGRSHATPILFAMEGHQGSYNAALVHLATMPEATADLLSHIKDYGWEGIEGECNSTLPPLWISVVGSNGQMIPVTYIAPAHYTVDPTDDNDNPDPLKYLFRRECESPSSPVTTSRPTIPHMWFTVFAVSLVVNGLLFHRFYRYQTNSHWGETAGDRAARYKQRADFAVGCLAQVLLYGMVAELAWTPLRANLFRHDGPRAFALGVLLLFSAAMAVVAWFRLLAVHWQEYSGIAWQRRKHAYKVAIDWSQRMLWCPNRLGRLSRGGFWIVFSDLFMLVLVTLTGLCFAWRNLSAALGDFDPHQVIYFERIVRLSSGVSPLLPRVFFCMALFAWSYFLVKKLNLAKHYFIESPFPEKVSVRFDRLRDLDRDLRGELMPPSTLQRHFLWCALMLVLVLIIFGKLAYDAPWPIDGRAFGVLTLFGFFTGSFLLLFTLLQFYFAWRSLRKLLRFVALLPMQGAFERLSDKVVAIFGSYLFSQSPRHSHLTIIVQQYYRLRRLFPAFRAKLEHAVKYRLALGQLTPALLNVAWRQVKSFPKKGLGLPVARQFEQELNPVGDEEGGPPANAPVLGWGGSTGEDIHQLTRRCLSVLHPFWTAHNMEEAFGRTHFAAESAAHDAKGQASLSLPTESALGAWIVAAEDFTAVEIIRYLSQFIVQLRNLLTCLTLGSLLLVLAATVYPFPSQSQLLLFLTILTGSIAALILTFLIQVNRDELISRITRGTANRFTPDWTFMHGTTAYVLPILAGLMVQFPFVTATLRSLLDPLSHIIK